MRTKPVFTAFVGLALVAGTAAAQSKPTIAVLPFTNSAIGASNAELAPLSKGLADLVTSALAANPGIRVVERDRIAAVLEEQKLSSGGAVDAATAVKVGKIVGAHHMITGVFVTEKSGAMKLVTRVFDVETSEIVSGAGAEETGTTAAIMSLVDKLAAKQNKNLKLPDLPAQAREEHAASAKKQEKVPFQAVMLYSRALDEKDHGNKDKAVTLFKQSLTAFPEYDAPKKELEKMGVK